MGRGLSSSNSSRSIQLHGELDKTSFREIKKFLSLFRYYMVELRWMNSWDYQRTTNHGLRQGALTFLEVYLRTNTFTHVTLCLNPLCVMLTT